MHKSIEAGRKIAVILGVRLREVRKLRGLTQAEVGDRLGGAASISLSRWENGRSEISLSRLLELSAVYGIAPSVWLLNDEGYNYLIAKLFYDQKE